MGDFRVTGATRLYVILYCMIVRAVLSAGLGKCPLYPHLPNFEIQRMVGTWYEVERSFYLMEMSASCVQFDVALSERGHLLITINTLNKWTNNPSTTHGVGVPSHNGSSSFRYKVNNRMPYLIGRLLPGAGHYNILFTDYKQFAVVWSCSSVSVAHSDRMWVLGRQRELGAAVRARIYGILEELRLDPDRLILSKNTNCTRDSAHAIN